MDMGPFKIFITGKYYRNEFIGKHNLKCTSTYHLFYISDKYFYKIFQNELRKLEDSYKVNLFSFKFAHQIESLPCVQI
jgi:hypothetical protein